MKTPKFLAVTTGLIASLVIAAPAWAGAELKIDDESSINLGFRVQAYAQMNESDLDSDDSFEDFTDFRIRRARIRLLGKINKHISAFLQTEFADDTGGTGADVRMIDAFVRVNYNPWAQIYAGQNMAPSSRQTLTSSGGLLAIDRPGNNLKNLTWGTRALRNFAQTTVGDTDGLLRGNNAVRDMGVTLFGSGKLSDTSHLKYYLGFYDGVQASPDRELRMTARAQVNFFDSEPGYYNLATYLGKKKTLGFGVSYDVQDEVDSYVTLDQNNEPVVAYGDYSYYSVDAFAEWPMGAGTLTAEAAFSDLDLDSIDSNALRSEGDGFYVQAGYLFPNNWQPWVEYETWDSKAAIDILDGSGNIVQTLYPGDYDSFRIGVSYFFKGHNANVKAGFEKFNTDSPFDGNEDSSTAFVLGFFITY